MQQGRIIKLKDLDTSDEAFFIVRHDDKSVVVGLSLKSNGDMQVAMTKQEAKELIEALKEAVHQK